MDNLAMIDFNMTNTSKSIATLKRSGIEVLDSSTLSSDYNVFSRLQPLCGNFGNHLPPNTTQEQSESTISWVNNTIPDKCDVYFEPLTKHNYGRIRGIDTYMCDN